MRWLVALSSILFILNVFLVGSSIVLFYGEEFGFWTCDKQENKELQDFQKSLLDAFNNETIETVALFKELQTSLLAELKNRSQENNLKFQEVNKLILGSKNETIKTLEAKIKEQNLTLFALKNETMDVAKKLLERKVEFLAKDCLFWKSKLLNSGNVTLKQLGKSTFFYNTTKGVSWAEANRICEEYESTLAVISSKEELKLIGASAPRNVWYWVGASNLGQNDANQFVWVDGRKENNSLWRSQPLSLSKGSERCVDFDKGNDYLSFEGCSAKEYVICKVNAQFSHC